MGHPTKIMLDDDVAARVEAEAERSQRSVGEVVNDLIRESLTPSASVPKKPFRVRPKNMGVPAIDLSCTSRALAVLDEMEGQ
jgi:hypothetical protein